MLNNYRLLWHPKALIFAQLLTFRTFNFVTFHLYPQLGQRDLILAMTVSQKCSPKNEINCRCRHLSKARAPKWFTRQTGKICEMTGNQGSNQ